MKIISSIKNYVKKNRILLNLYENIFQRPIINYYKSSHRKKVLFVYSTYHFKKKNYTAHSNYSESLIIAKLFNELGYRIDIINNNRFYKNIDFKSYDIIFGEGISMYEAIKSNTSAKIIYYATTSHPFQCTKASLNRLIDFYKRTNFLAYNSLRLQDERFGIAASTADYVIAIGNENTKKTFIDNGVTNIQLINPTFYGGNTPPKIEKRSDAKRNLLYFASYGLLHKGLDLVVDAMKDLKDFNLYVCGHIDREQEFINMLNIPKNVSLIGFIDIKSIKFKDLAQKCGFVIMPSASEGTATSIITAMGLGAMIPIVTKECGVDIEDFGILIKDLTVEAVKESILKILELDDKEYENRCKKAQLNAYEKYTIDKYEKQMRIYLTNLCVREQE